MTNSEMLEIVNELYGNGKNGFLEFLDYNRCYNLLQEATNSANISTPKQLISKIKQKFKKQYNVNLTEEIKYLGD